VTLQASASKSELLIQCARPFEDGITTDDEAGEPARYGSAFHELMELPTWKVNVLTPVVLKMERKWNIPGAASELVGHVRAARRLLKRWMRGENQFNINFAAGKVENEVAFAINPHELTVRRIELPSVEDHVYQDVDALVEIPGTADRITNFPLVMDYKTGRDPFDFFTVPEDVSQLRTLGVAVWLETRERVDVFEEEVILAVLHTPRGSMPAIYADAVSVKDLRKHAQQLSEALARRGDGSMRRGPCCRVCSARYDCPLQLSTYIKGAGEALEMARSAGIELKDLVEYGRNDFELVRGDPPQIFDQASSAIVTSDDVGKLHYFIAQFDRLQGAAQSLMKQWVIDNTGKDVAVRPDGKVLVIKTKEQENLSKASIIRALGKLRGEALIQELRENGVIEMTERTELHAVDDK